LTTSFDLLAIEKNKRRWLVTGGAGFIGSHLTEALLSLGQEVIVLDNFSSGNQRNLDLVTARVPLKNQSNLRVFHGDIEHVATCEEAMVGVDYVLHHAALGSVPWSIRDPILANRVNVNGFLNLLIAARDAKVKSFIYASSSAVYGDDSLAVKVESSIGVPLSPYAATKRINEVYASGFVSTYGMNVVGLRYFNIFGPRQNPSGAYAAVIPKWIESLLKGKNVEIFGEGDTSRDFCYIDNVVQANLRAAFSTGLQGQVFNIGSGASTSLNELFSAIIERIQKRQTGLKNMVHALRPTYGPYRSGDILHSSASIELASKDLGYAPTVSVSRGLDLALDWYISEVSNVGGVDGRV
jgi:UDP-N-acetylglucosamine 4-epimerase